MKKSGYRLRIFIIVSGLLFVSFSYYAYQIFFTPNFLIDKGDKATSLYIPSGATIETVKDSIEKLEILHDKTSFYFLTRLMEYNENVKPGRYLIQPRMTNLEVIRKLKRGQQDPVNVRINNIRIKKDLAARFSRYLEPDSMQFDSMLRDPATASRYGMDTNTIMAMFIPNTYEFFWNVSAVKVFDRMHKEYEKFWTEERKSKAKNLGLTPLEVITVASILVEETNNHSEMPRIAGVYLNRLKTNMPLQADPTLKFAIGDFSIKRILEGHTKIESPYNTYKYAGLPPGPINLPSITAIDAVLNAENHKYLYFCASAEKPGTHEFAETYNQHLVIANAYWKYLNKNRIR